MSIKNKMARKLDTKETIQFIASLVLLVIGIVLVFLGFYAVPIGEIHYTVITVFGMFLTFVGAIWQIDVKYEFKTQELMKNMRKSEDSHQNDEE